MLRTAMLIALAFTANPSNAMTWENCLGRMNLALNPEGDGSGPVTELLLLAYDISLLDSGDSNQRQSVSREMELVDDGIISLTDKIADFCNSLRD